MFFLGFGLGAALVGGLPRAAAAQAARVPPLPDASGWGVHILALARGPDGSVWAGSYGEGIFIYRPGAREWENLRADTLSGSIASDYVHAFAFGPAGQIWYGSIGGGWGLSQDGGRTWRTWTSRERGPDWSYVAPNGITTRGDTLYVGTAGGITMSWSRGRRWVAVPDSGSGALPSPYVLALEPARDGGLWVSTLRGIGRWQPGAAFQMVSPRPTPTLGPRIRSIFVVSAPGAVVPLVLGGERCAGSLRPRRREEPEEWRCLSISLGRGSPALGRSVRALGACGGLLCAAATSAGAILTERIGLVNRDSGPTARANDVYAVLPPAEGEAGDTLVGTACGLMGSLPPACVAGGDTAGVSRPAPPAHTWFGRPIAPADQPFIDQTYRYGSTMGGALAEHQGVAFNNPAGTPILAIGTGTVLHAGWTDQGSLAVAILHDSTWVTAGPPAPRPPARRVADTATVAARPPARLRVFSAYHHNSQVLVSVGQRVRRGQVIAWVGSSGGAPSSRLRLEVHLAPSDSVQPIVGTVEGALPYARNPELWIEPLPGTGIVVGQVWDGANQPVRRARVYGLVKPEPQETPFSYAETYGPPGSTGSPDRSNPDPAYGEHFAVSDVPAGTYVLGVEIEGRKVFRRVRVEEGRVTWVVFRP